MSSWGCQKSVLGILALVVQAAVSLLTRVLGTKLWCSVRSARAFNHLSRSPGTVCFSKQDFKQARLTLNSAIFLRMTLNYWPSSLQMLTCPSMLGFIRCWELTPMVLCDLDKFSSKWITSVDPCLFCLFVGVFLCFVFLFVLCWYWLCGSSLPRIHYVKRLVLNSWSF